MKPNRMYTFLRIFLVVTIVFYNVPMYAQGQKKPNIVFLITKDTNNYEAHITIPIYAESLKKEHGYNTTVLLGKGTHGDYAYTGLEALSKADLLVIMARRIALPHDQMSMIKNYLKSGKPLVGIRTANHAFKVMEEISEGHEDWFEFVADYLGCENQGYGPHEEGYDVTIIPESTNHPIVKNLPVNNWHSGGSLYLVELLDKEANVLLQGKINDKIEPVAWTRKSGKNKVFYTSLGFPADFSTPQFLTLLTNGIKWTLEK